MITLSPFKGLLPPKDKAHLVAAPPYDVVNKIEAAQSANRNPLSFLRVSRSEIELAEGVDPYSDQVYQKAKENFTRLCEQGPLSFDDTESFYIYSITMKGHRQTGLVAAVSVGDYDEDRVKKHELTRQAKEDDRTRHTLTIRAHTGPVFLTYRPQDSITNVSEEVTKGEPLFDVHTEDGICHKIWRVPNSLNSEISSLFTKVPCLYVADGHHRAKSASRTRGQCQSENTQHTGEEAYNRFLSVIFPADQLQILPYNRIVTDLNGLTTDEFRRKIKEVFQIRETDRKSPDTKGRFHMYLNQTWYELISKPGNSEGSVVDQLDVAILQQKLLSPILGIDDPRTNTRIDFVGGIHGPERLETLANIGKAAVAFSLYPVTVNELMAISDAGMIMPPKSTWFEPKLRDGLVCHCF